MVGCTCSRPPHTYTKKSYGRSGVPLSCASNEDQIVLLCYPRCRPGYSGVGPLCLSRCRGETTDIGLLCQKKFYGRGVGKLSSCFRLSRDDFKKADTSSISSLMKGAKTRVLTKAFCLGLWAASKRTINFLRAFAQCSSTWNTLVISISGSQSLLLSLGVEIGIAVDLTKQKAVCYEQTCKGVNLDVSVGIGINFGWFRSLDDIPGKASIIFGGIEIPQTEIGVSFAGVINSNKEYIGTLSTVGLGVGASPLPFEAGGAECNTPKSKIIKFRP